MPSGSLQWVRSYDETDKDIRVTGYSKQIQLTPATDRSTESLNPSCSLTVQLAIGSCCQANWVTVHYNQKKLLDFVSVRRRELIINQLEDTMKCSPKPTDRPRRRTKNNRLLKKCAAISETSNPKLK